MTPENAPLTPQPVFEMMTAFHRSAAIKTAVELDLFTKIAEGNNTAATIAAACGAAERGIRILCDTMTVLGFLTKQGNEYGLTGVSAAFLNQHSPAYLGNAIDFLMSRTQISGFEDLTAAVKQGGSTVDKEGSLDPESPMWVKFARGMTGLMFPSALYMAGNLGLEPDRKLKVLDIAAGHGIFGIMLAQKYPNAEIYAVDWANVLTVARENAEKFGVADRHHLVSGSAFEVDYGTGYDVILVTNFLHHFDKQTCETFLKKVNAALADDGQVWTLEFIPNDDRVSPPVEAMFSLVMLAATPAGDAYTFAELKDMYQNAGFSRNEHRPMPGMPQHWIVSRKKV
jgi:2-polyprenyl-3-methyl-5-hydroxy-6-metoxy-1,4-benzoquinol methylase